MIAAQIRLQYHGFRGEAEHVRRAYEQMETSAIEAGTSWQVETWSAISINLFGALWHDVIITKRALRETQRMKVNCPRSSATRSRPRRRTCCAAASRATAQTCTSRVLAKEAPLSRIGWSVSSGLLAEAYNQLGMHAEAKALCERVLAAVDADDRPYYAMRIVLEVPYAMALSALRRARARGGAPREPARLLRGRRQPGRARHRARSAGAHRASRAAIASASPST